MPQHLHGTALKITGQPCCSSMLHKHSIFSWMERYLSDFGFLIAREALCLFLERSVGSCLEGRYPRGGPEQCLVQPAEFHLVRGPL